MTDAVNRAHASAPAPSPRYPSLSEETRATLPTPEAAYHLNRKPQTLRRWVWAGSAPITPIRVHGRLAWPVDQIKRLMGVEG